MCRAFGRCARSGIRDPTIVLHGTVGAKAHELVHDLRTSRSLAVGAGRVQGKSMAGRIALTLFGHLRCTVANVISVTVATFNLPTVA